MLAKKTSKNQITIPKKIIEQIPNVAYFNVEFKEGVILLKPMKFYETDLENIRRKMRTLGMDDKSVAEAVKWARSK